MNDSVTKAVTVERLTKRYGNAVAVDDVSFTAEAGAFTTLLGPSGCGKTTTLRAIGGFTTVDAGTISIGGTPIDTLPPYKRPTRTVFQSYALFPHMTVFENVAFGLRATRVRRAEIPPLVEEALGMVGLEKLARRQSGELSGGQQQRVAFARALVTRPDVLLLDEPLSNLDAKLRVQMRLEIRRLQREVGITTIYVTHDQEEAMSLSDHVIVMNGGRIEQQGPPSDIYERPANRFVADFIGTSNLVPVTVSEVGESSVSVMALGEALSLPSSAMAGAAAAGAPMLLVVRPEHVLVLAESGRKPPAVADSDSPPSPVVRWTFSARVVARDYRGAAADYLVEVDGGQQFTVEVPSPKGTDLLDVGSTALLGVDLSRSVLIPAASPGA